MTLTDTHLTDPSAKEIHATIVAAFHEVSKQGITARISHTQVSLKRAAASAATQPEGLECWSSRTQIASGIAGQVLVAWWTTVGGRRHVRVIGRTVNLETSYLLTATKLATRPAVWHVFPDRVYRRRAGKANDLIAVCGCGAVGTEKALGWAGPCCGPCSDFREEHGALPWKRPALLPTPQPCVAVAASADGRWVAGAGTEVRPDSGKVWVWDLDRADQPPQVHVSPRGPDALLPRVALSHDGRFLATRLESPDFVSFLDQGPGGKRQLLQVAPLAFHPVEHSVYGVTSSGALVTSTFPPVNWRTVPEVRAEPAGPLAFSRDGSRVAVGGDETIRVYELNGTGRAWFPFPRSYHRGIPRSRSQFAAPHVAFSPDGGQVAVGYDYAVAVHHAVTSEQRFLDGTLEGEVSGVAFDPGGKWLYVGRRDGTLVAYRTDTFAPERSVVFRWSLGPIRAMTVCGDALLSACDEGVQIWPMPKLLEGL
jgi:hypothetical protein